MARVARSRAQFEIFRESSINEDDHASDGYDSSPNLGNNRFAPLRSIAVANAHAQNHQPSRLGSSSHVESLTAELKKLHIGETHELRRFKNKPNLISGKPKGASQATSRPIGTTFEVLETVPEVEQHSPPDCAAFDVSDGSQHYYIELPSNQYSHNPLALAARHLPPAQEQLAKHHEGNFEWVLTVRVPANPIKGCNTCKSNPANRPPEFKKAFFGCNLLSAQPKSQDALSKDAPSISYALLVTPLEGNQELLEAEAKAVEQENMNMAVAGVPATDQTTPSKATGMPEVRVQEISPSSNNATAGDDSSYAEIITSKSPAKPKSRIEDSVEALDKLEETLEELSQVAHMRRSISPDMIQPVTTPKHSLAARPNGSARSTPQSTRLTPQSNRPSPRAASATLRVKSTPTRPASVRKSASMIFLDSPKPKEEDKSLVQAPPKRLTIKPVASLQPPKPPAKSSKPSTVPQFELPGEAVARRLKEKREARLSVQAAAEPAPTAGNSSTIRRAKSTRAPTIPKFELPGEAISRQKREAREAKLKAQEEEERRRREFKARPIRSGAIPSSVPRETIASLARKGALVNENTAQPGSVATTPNRRASMMVMNREPLSSANNQSQPRGRNLTISSKAATMSRATSSSTGTGSISGKRSSVSYDDVEKQRLRGKGIWQRDNLFGKEKEKEKRDRETLARIAREEAAERSRAQSREWAEKRKRKRMTIGSLRDVVA